MSWKGFKDIQATIIIDITPSEEEILKKTDRSRKKNIKKAVESGLVFVEAKSEEEWNEWYKIYCKVWNEGGIESQDMEIFKKQNYKLFLIKKEDKILGGGVFEELEDRIIFKAYASLIEYQEFRINDFLYWNSFLYAKNKGKQKVDLGGWQIKAKGHLEGVNEFKEKWGGEKIYYYIYNKNPFYILGRKAYRNIYPFRWVVDRLKGRPIQKKDKNKINKKSYETKESIEHFENLNEKGLFENEKKLVEKYFHGKILDLGCGVGRTTKDLYDLGYKDITGIDIAENMIKKAKERYPEINFQTGDACKLKISDESFDVVFFSYNGLDYIFPESERKKAVNEISRVLKKGGYFIYSSHNPNALFFKIRPKFLVRNISKLTIFSKYKYEKQNFGELYTYYASPKQQIKFVESANPEKTLKFVEKFSEGLIDLHPHYVFRKV